MGGVEALWDPRSVPVTSSPVVGVGRASVCLSAQVKPVGTRRLLPTVQPLCLSAAAPSLLRPPASHSAGPFHRWRTWPHPSEASRRCSCVRRPLLTGFSLSW